MRGISKFIFFSFKLTEEILKCINIHVQSDSGNISLYLVFNLISIFCKNVGLSSCRTIEPSNYPAVGLSIRTPMYKHTGFVIFHIFFLWRCKLPFYENDTFAVQSSIHDEMINASIPKKLDGSYSECTLLVNGTEEKCSEWVYDQSQFIRTVTSDVS